MHQHIVFFWMKDGVDATQRAGFVQALEALCKEPNIAEARFGTPADTNRDVVDNSYDYALVLGFETLAAHDRYQNESAIHDQFIATGKALWERVLVYDVNV